MIKEVKQTRTPRFDGPVKVTGVADYTSDQHFPNLAIAVPVCAKIAKGRIKTLDTSEAKKMKGVLEVYTRQNIGQMYRPNPEPGFDYRTDEPRPPFEDDEISYYGQYIALVVAENFEIAQRAARSIKATYQAQKPDISHDYKQEDLKKVEAERGDAAGVFAKAPVKVDFTYTTPIEVHNAIELHATVANWEADDRLTVFETSQAIVSARNVLAQMMGLPSENVRVITKYLGSGFGGKLWAWPHSAMCAAAARNLKRPVKLVIDRHMAFTNVGHRPRTEQRMKIASSEKGELQALVHEYSTQATPFSDYKENCGEVSGLLYKIPAVKVTSGVARRNIAVPTSMRGPGAVPGSFALESALDELAIKLNMDPVQLRILNDTQIDQNANKKFSSRHLIECLEVGADRFGWKKRNPKIGSMRDGDEILGWGMAGCTWHAARLATDATFKFLGNGRVELACGTHDIGTGMYTVIAQLVKDETGLPFDRIDVKLGDTNLPKGAIAGGSMATSSVIPAVLQAVRNGVKNLKAASTKVATSPLKGKKPDDLKFQNGKLAGYDFETLLKKINMSAVEGRGSSNGTRDSSTPQEFSTRSFGSHFVEVGWNPEIAKLRVRRVLSVIDGGRIINYRPGRNQIEGAVVMGVGMALFEEALYDHRDGNCVNSSLADYVMTVHADCPDMDVVFLDYPDKALNEYGARGIGEIGLAGTAAAITNAVYHATGVRVRDLPVTIEKLLKAQQQT